MRDTRSVVGETGTQLSRADATREAIDRDGWLNTGDVACVDQEGFVYIKDRLKDLIIRGGENVSAVVTRNDDRGDRGDVDPC